MADLWQDEGFGAGGAVGDEGADDDWDEGEESIELSIDDGFDNPVELEDEDGWGDEEDS
jgi:hypothetical protein